MELFEIVIGQRSIRVEPRIGGDTREGHKTARIAIRQEPQQHAVDDAEHGRAGSDADRENPDEKAMKTGREAESSQRVPEIGGDAIS